MRRPSWEKSVVLESYLDILVIKKFLNMPKLITARVKLVLAGNIFICVTMDSEPKEEVIVTLCGISAPNYRARSPSTSSPYAFRSKEFLRERLIGRKIQFDVVSTVTDSPKKVIAYAYVAGVLINEQVVRAGWATANQKILAKYNASYLSGDPNESSISAAITASSAEDPHTPSSLICEAHYTAMYIKKVGMHSDKTELSTNPELIEVFVSDTNQDMSSKINSFLTAFKNRRLSGVVEHIKDAGYIYVSIVHPEDYTTQFKIIASPFCVQTPSDHSDLTFCLQESRELADLALLGRTVCVTPFSKLGSNIIACDIETLIKKDTYENYGLMLVSKGYGKLVDWMAPSNADLADTLRQAETEAKIGGIGIWKHIPSSVSGAIATGALAASVPTAPAAKQFQGVCTDVPSADSLVLKTVDGTLRRVWLASVMTKRCLLNQYPDVDVFGYRCRETLRRAYHGQQLEAIVEYSRSGADSGSTREYASVYTVGVDRHNIAIGIIEAGLAWVVKHPASDSNRSSDYVALQEAELRSAAAKTGMNAAGVDASEKITVTDVNSFSVAEIRSRAIALSKSSEGTYNAIVEGVMTGSKMRVSISFGPKSITTLFISVAGIISPSVKKNEAYGQEALSFARDTLLMRSVTIKITGSTEHYTSTIYAIVTLQDKQDFAELTISNGLARVNHTKSNPCGIPPGYLVKLNAVEAAAISERRGLFSVDVGGPMIDNPGSWDEPADNTVFGIDIASDGKLVFRLLSSAIPEITAATLKSFGATGLTEATVFIRSIVAYQPEDSERLYRARIEKIDKQSQTCTVYLIDHGKLQKSVPFESLYGPLPNKLVNLPPVAMFGRLALVNALARDIPETQARDRRAGKGRDIDVERLDPKHVTEYYKTVSDAFIGKTIHVYTCGYGPDGNLNMFVMTDGCTKFALEDSLSFFLIANGYAKLISDSHLPDGAAVGQLYDELADAERDALHARYGIWR